MQTQCLLNLSDRAIVDKARLIGGNGDSSMHTGAVRASAKIAKNGSEQVPPRHRVETYLAYSSSRRSIASPKKSNKKGLLLSMTADSKNEAAFDYLAAASKVALKLAETAVERDEKGAHPHQEIGLLREAGLLELVAPIYLAGHAVPWVDTLPVLRTISAADGSIGQLLIYHYVNSYVPLLFGTPAEATYHVQQQVTNRWYVADAINPLSPPLDVIKNKHGFVVNGTVSFSTRVAVSQRTIITPTVDGVPYFASIPTNRPGVQVNDDWQQS